MFRKILTLFLIILTQSGWCQRPPSEYYAITKKADSLFKAHDFKNSALSFSNAFKLFGWRGLIHDRYTAASAWAMSSVPDSAFANLQRIVTKEKYSHYSIRYDNNFESLHKDIRWEPLIIAVEKNELEKAVNSKLAKVIDSLVDEDQKWRGYLRKYHNKQFVDGNLSEQKIQNVIKRVDSINYFELRTIITNYGYPNNDLVGVEASHNFWLLVQHQDLHPDFQNEVLVKMKVEADNGKSSLTDYAYLIDRVNVNTGKLQVYGTQMRINAENTSYECQPVMNPENLNERRKSVGLESIENYIVAMNTRYFGTLKTK